MVRGLCAIAVLIGIFPRVDGPFWKGDAGRITRDSGVVVNDRGLIEVVEALVPRMDLGPRFLRLFQRRICDSGSEDP